MQMRETATEMATGKWHGILPALGIPAHVLNGKAQACPMCGGDDRFTFTNRNNHGAYVCRGCGGGSGYDLLMKLGNIDFKTAVNQVREICGTVTASYQKPETQSGMQRMVDYAMRLWNEAQHLTGTDTVCRYLERRSIRLDRAPSQIKFNPRVGHKIGNETRHFPALISQFICPKAKQKTYQITLLTERGEKAPVDPTARKMAKGLTMSEGGAVRLCSSAETMGIAEGVETALSAQQLFDVPVWAALNTARMLTWDPPPTAKNIIVFGDNDDNFAGQLAAFGLASRLKSKGLNVEVRMPTHVDTDWNDELVAQRRRRDIRRSPRAN